MTKATDRLELLKYLSPAKRALLLKMLRDEAIRGEQPNVIVRRSRQDMAPLSFAQQRLWVLDQLEPGNPAYNIFRPIRLTGTLNVAVMQKSFSEIVRRHEALRTTFQVVEHQPVQVISPPLSVSLPLVDLRELGEARGEAEARRVAAEEARRPFDLARGPLLRVSLLWLGEGDYMLLLTMHHIISDAWSVALLVNELTALYGAFLSGKPSPLPEPAIQYTDFALWQREWLQAGVLANQLSYWKERLGATFPKLDLPTDRPRPAVHRFRGAHYSFALPPALSDSLRAFSRREEVTLFMTLLAAFRTLLYCYTGEKDIIVGTPIAGRNRVETEDLIGLFINMLALRIDFSGDPGFRGLLQRVREVVLQAYAHQDLPFEKLVAELQLSRDASRPSMFQVGFDLHNEAMPTLQLPGLTLRPVEIETGNANADLILYMREMPDRIHGLFEYCTDLFEAASISRMAEQFQMLAQAIVADPERRLCSLRQLVRGSSPAKRIAVERKETLEETFEGSNLTKYQLLIWIGQKLNPDVSINTNAFNFTIPVSLDPAHFRASFQTLVNSSDALRTVIEEKDGKPQQRILEEFPYEMEFYDFSLAADPHAEVRAWTHDRVQAPFDFQKRLFDSVLLKISEDEFIWHLNIDHVICDAWSYTIAFKLVAQLYEASLTGLQEGAIALPQFQSYVRYEREHRGSPQYLEAEAYWKGKLSRKPEPLTYYGEAASKLTTRIERASFNIGVERTEKLTEIARRKEVMSKSVDASLANIFAAVLLTFLYRVSGNHCIWLGVPHHNRNSQAFKETVGMFMHILPLQITIEEEDTFLSLIKKVAAEAGSSVRYRQYPVGNPTGDRAYEVEFNFINATFPDFHGAQAKVEWLRAGHGNETLAVQVHDLGRTGSFNIEFDFKCDAFDEQQRGQTIKHFLQILDALIEDYNCPLNRPDLLSTRSQREKLSVLESELDFDFDL